MRGGQTVDRLKTPRTMRDIAARFRNKESMMPTKLSAITGVEPAKTVTGIMA
jgi:hypothetical protein